METDKNNLFEVEIKSFILLLSFELEEALPTPTPRPPYPYPVSAWPPKSVPPVWALQLHPIPATSQENANWV